MAEMSHGVPPFADAGVPPRRFVSNSRESVRMFRLDWMEALSKVYWWVPPLVYLPLIAALFVHALAVQRLAPLAAVAWLAGGMLIWTPAEYLLHRFVFHYVPRADWGKRLHFIFHGVHHDYPNDAHRLVMPPSASLPIAFAFYLLFGLLLSGAPLEMFFAGFLAGYLAYDLTHYALHHASWRNPLFAWLKRNHMQHHFVDPSRRYGVSSPLWDWLLGTRARG